MTHDGYFPKPKEAAQAPGESLMRCVDRSLPIAVSAVDLSGRQIYMNDAFVRLVGWPREALVGQRPPFVYWAGDHRAAIESMFAATLDGRAPCGGWNLLLKRRSGEHVALRVQVSPLEDGRSQIGWLAHWTDPSAGGVFDDHTCTMVHAATSSTEGIAVTDACGRFVFVNPAFAQIHGWSPEELIGRTWSFFLDGAAGTGSSPERDERIRLGGTLVSEHELRRDDGSPIPIEARVTGLVRHGRFVGTICHARDLTAERRTERELVRLRRAVEASSEVIFLTEPDGTFSWVNSEFTRLYGWASHEVVGRATPRILKGGETSAEKCAKMWQTILSGHGYRAEYRNQTRNGSFVWVDGAIDPLVEADGSIGGFVAIQRDVSERRLLTDQLVQAQKMEAVGRLAGGIAHDFNNVLTVISGFTDLLLEETPASTPAHADLREIRTAAERAAGMTRQLLGFSRRDAPTRSAIDLNAVLGSVEKLVRRAIGEDIALLFDPWDAPLRVQADPAEVTQLVLNLAVNSRDAMPNGGSLTIAVERLRDEALTSESRPGGHYAAISVTDSGCGMPPEVVERAFDPFFTTKPIGQGTGLGLSIVYGVVHRMGGHVALDSRPGQGTTVTIYVPLAEEKELRALPVVPEAPARGRGEVILLVEDEDAVRAVAHRMLRHAGYQVVEARSAGEALLEFETRGEEIALLLSDVIMPQLSGTELAARLRERRPDLRTVFVTGYSSDASHDAMVDLGAVCLHKPFSARDLLATVRAALDA